MAAATKLSLEPRVDRIVREVLPNGEEVLSKYRAHLFATRRLFHPHS